jgi:hypothetical protein
MVFRSPEYNILVLLLVLYIIIGVHAPFIINNTVHTFVILILLVVFVIYIAYNSDIYLTILSIIASLLFIYRTHSQFFSLFTNNTSSTSTKIYEDPGIPVDTLEQDMVRIRIPNSKFLPSPGISLFTDTPSFVPIEDSATLQKSTLNQTTYL